MTVTDGAYTRLQFVDFIYAVVIGSVFPSIAPLEPSVRFFGMLLLLLVALEDFYLVHTQLARFRKRIVELTFFPLAIEVAISLSWYLSATAFPEKKHQFLVAFSCFFIFKWLAGFVHWRSFRMLSNWRFKRNYLYFVAVVVCLVLLFTTANERLDNPKLWVPIAFAWAFQTALWWKMTRMNGVEEQAS